MPAGRAVLLRPLSETQGEEKGPMPLQRLFEAVPQKQRLLLAFRQPTGLCRRIV
jgi:hypothetical protein